MLIAKHMRQIPFIFLLAIIALCSFLVSILPDFFMHGVQQVNEQVRSSIEGLGAIVAIAMSLVLLHFHQDSEKETGDFFLLSMGFLTMGILDVFVAVSISGQGFNLLHSFRSIFGSLWFALIWLPGFRGYISKIKSVPWIVASLSVLIGCIVFSFPELFPAMTVQGEFSSLAILINMITEILFFAAAVYFLLEFLRSSATDSYLFTCVFVLLALSAYGFRLSTIWTEDWWFWHIQRLLAYMVMFFYIFSSFLRVSNELKIMNKTLEKQVVDRTSELSREVADRKRYGKERDTVIVELRDALAQIKLLTGILPTCASCKKIRDANGNWEQMEMYITKHSDAKFSHGICPECTKKLYPEIYEEIMLKTTPQGNTTSEK